MKAAKEPHESPMQDAKEPHKHTCSSPLSGIEKLTEKSPTKDAQKPYEGCKRTLKDTQKSPTNKPTPRSFPGSKSRPTRAL